jgi:phosphoglycolate phosphatase-like HAD superfamily hydrolase
VLRRIRLLILDLDYVVFDCAPLKVQALRQSMIALADSIPQSASLPRTADAEEGFREYGRQWIRHLEFGMDEGQLDDLRQTYAVQENRLVESGSGRIYPGIQAFLTQCRQINLATALGADADRNYLVTVSDRFELDGLFRFTLCTEEFGQGGADEMLEEIMRHAEVNPSETLVLGTRPDYFRDARALDILSIGCGWGIQQHSALAEADLQALSLSQLFSAIEKADAICSQNFDQD